MILSELVSHVVLEPGARSQVESLVRFTSGAAKDIALKVLRISVVYMLKDDIRRKRVCSQALEG